MFDPADEVVVCVGNGVHRPGVDQAGHLRYGQVHDVHPVAVLHRLGADLEAGVDDDAAIVGRFS